MPCLAVSWPALGIATAVDRVSYSKASSSALSSSYAAVLHAHFCGNERDVESSVCQKYVSKFASLSHASSSDPAPANEFSSRIALLIDV